MINGPIIKDIILLNEDDIENREVLVTLSNGTQVYIDACYESFQQWGNTTDELWITLPIAEEYNDWLHGI